MVRLRAIASVCILLALPALAQDESPPPASDEVDFELGSTRLADLPPEVLAKLDADDIVEILSVAQASQIVDFANDGGALNYLIAQSVPIAFFLLILAIVVSAHRLRARKQAQLHETLRLMIEKGAEIPPELFAPPVSAHGDLRRGLILLGIGLSLALLIGLVEGFAEGSWAVGLIPGFVGIAYLIVWCFSQREAKA